MHLLAFGLNVNTSAATAAIATTDPMVLPTMIPVVLLLCFLHAEESSWKMMESCPGVVSCFVTVVFAQVGPPSCWILIWKSERVLLHASD